MRTIDEIILHCTATEAGKEYTANDIDQWHKARGWKGIGYHFVILINGTIQVGKSIEEAGAHCKGHNAHSIGVVYVGGLHNGKPADTRTLKQMEALNRLLFDLLLAYPTIKKITGHNEYANKACPCFDVKPLREMFKFRLSQ